MSVTSTRTTTIGYTGDMSGTTSLEDAANAGSPGQIDQLNLLSGNNTITLPTGAVSVTLVPPAGNLVVLTLKGVNGDTGVAIHLTNPMTLSFGATVASFVINAAQAVPGFRLFWT